MRHSLHVQLFLAGLLLIFPGRSLAADIPLSLDMRQSTMAFDVRLGQLPIEGELSEAVGRVYVQPSNLQIRQLDLRSRIDNPELTTATPAAYFLVENLVRTFPAGIATFSSTAIRYPSPGIAEITGRLAVGADAENITVRAKQTTSPAGEVNLSGTLQRAGNHPAMQQAMQGRLNFRLLFRPSVERAQR